jgi:nickel transport protein
LFAFASSAHAHRLHLFVETDGRTITGQAYAEGGRPIAGATVRITGPEATGLFGEVETDDTGEFSWRLTHRCEHVLSMTVDGHMASQRIAAEEFDPSLPTLGVDTVPYPGEAPLADFPTDGKTPAHSVPEAEGVRQAVAAEIAPLQRQIRDLSRRIDHYESRVRLHDILGGLGYIAGLAALAFFLTRSKPQSET